MNSINPVQMTRAEYQAKYGSAPQVSASASDAPIQMTRAQYQEKYGSIPNSAPNSASSIKSNPSVSPPQNQGIFASEVNFGKSIADSIAAPKAVQQVESNQNAHSQSLTNLINLSKSDKDAGKDTTHLDTVIHQIANTDPSAYGAKLSDIIPSVDKTNKQIIGEGTGVLADLLTGSGGLGASAGGAAIGASRAAQNNKSGGNIASDAIIGAVAGKILDVGFSKASPYINAGIEKYGLPFYEKIAGYVPEASQNSLKDLASKATEKLSIGSGTGGTDILDKVNKVVDAPFNLLEGTKNAAQNKITSIAENSAKKDWIAPTTKTNASYSKATDVYNNAQSSGHDIADTLVKNGTKLSDNISEGKYATADTAEKIRSDAGKLSNELLRPALQKADAATPLTPVEDITKATIRDIENSKGITPGDVERQISKAKSEGESLKRKFPDGMRLSDMHDTRINYASNGKYSPIGDTTVNNNANVNRSFGRVLAKEVKNNAPEDIPVDAFQKALQKQYQAADYLDALDTKRVPIGVGTKILRAGAKGVGSALGSTAGLGGSFAGYSIGGIVESTLEGLPATVRDSLLGNLEKTNPEAFSKISDYLKQPAEKVYNVLKPDTGLPKEPEVNREMGSYKLRKNPVTGRVEETGQYRKPGVNFYPKLKSK